jgi:hypothetical protein
MKQATIESLRVCAFVCRSKSQKIFATKGFSRHFFVFVFSAHVSCQRVVSLTELGKLRANLAGSESEAILAALGRLAALDITVKARAILFPHVVSGARQAVSL